MTLDLSLVAQYLILSFTEISLLVKMLKEQDILTTW